MTKLPNCLVNCFEHLYFRHYNLFRISDFVLRNSKNWFRASCFEFAFLFNLGVLRPVEYSHGWGISVALVTLFHGASPVEYLHDQDRVVLPKHYSTGESILLFDSLNSNSNITSR